MVANYKSDEIGYTGPSFPWRLTPAGKVATSTVNIGTGDTSLIAEAVTQIIRTRKGERFFRRGWGGEPVNLVFRPNTEEEMLLAGSEIQDVLSEYEPRAKLVEFGVEDQDPDQGLVSLRVGVEIIGSQLVDLIEVKVQ
jgi:phage baseplate assembly protein W